MNLWLGTFPQSGTQHDIWASHPERHVIALMAVLWMWSTRSHSQGVNILLFCQAYLHLYVSFKNELHAWLIVDFFSKTNSSGVLLNDSCFPQLQNQLSKSELWRQYLWMSQKLQPNLTTERRQKLIQSGDLWQTVLCCFLSVCLDVV